MPLLDVPLIQQPPESGECGMACLAMIHAYHKTGVSYENIRNEVQLVEANFDMPFPGLCMPTIGSQLQQKGLKTKMIMANQRLFCGDDIGLPPEKVREIIEGQKPQAKNEVDAAEINEFSSYFNAGGIVQVAIPTIEHIRQEIEQGRPLIALMTTRFLRGIRSMNFHFTVVTGFDDSQIFVNDPGNPEGGKKTHPQDWWLHCLIASTYTGWDNASLLCIQPKG